jgi:hypothetical protein
MHVAVAHRVRHAVYAFPEVIGAALEKLPHLIDFFPVPLALLIVFLPIGSGAASNLWAAVADDWHASANTVALVTGVVGGGKRTLPDGFRLDLGLIEERRFSGGFVYLRYRRS